MHEFGQALSAGFELLAGFDQELLEIVMLSLRVSLTATVVSCIIGAPLGAALPLARFRGRAALLIVVNAALGLPPVVVGLIVYLLASQSGPLGSLGLLFTPAAMMLAQTILAIPIVIVLVHQSSEYLWSEYGDALRVDGATPARCILMLLTIGKTGVLTGFLAAFGRTIAEVGAILIVGGNIRGYTRTMTTAIVLETSKGELARALGLGFILITLTLAVSACAFVLGRLGRR